MVARTGGAALRAGFLSCLLFSCSPGPTPDSHGARKEIVVLLAGNSFNPSQGEAQPIRLLLPRNDEVRVTVHEDHGLKVRSLFQGRCPRESLSLSWDGKDDEDEILPDEAYYVKVTCIRGRDTLLLDPPSFSGGEVFDVGRAAFDPHQGTLQYNLPRDARVLVRAGEQKGLLLKNIAHMAPRLKGPVLEHWNGKDADNLLSGKQLPDWQVVIAGISLPEHSIVTYGNKASTYGDYFSRKLARRPFRTPESKFSGRFQAALLKTRRKVDNHFTLPLHQDRIPEVVAHFPNAPDTLPEKIPLLRGTQRMEIDIDPNDKLFLREQQFEIMFFVDGKLVAEDEVGYIPYNWVWNAVDAAEGEHVVSVNVASFKDQIGTKSLKVMVRHR